VQKRSDEDGPDNKGHACINPQGKIMKDHSLTDWGKCDNLAKQKGERVQSSRGSKTIYRFPGSPLWIRIQTEDEGKRTISTKNQ